MPWNEVSVMGQRELPSPQPSPAGRGGGVRNTVTLAGGPTRRERRA
jgi:hypothetical protein